jgi:hypothetical protein
MDDFGFDIKKDPICVVGLGNTPMNRAYIPIIN